MPKPGCVESRWFKTEVHCFYRRGSWFVLDVPRVLVFDLSLVEAKILSLRPGEIALLETGDSELSYRFSSAEVTQALGNLEKDRLLRRTPKQPLPTTRRVFPEINTLELNIAQDCNLRCKYCSVKQGSFGGRRAKMSPEVALAAVDFLLCQSRDSDTISLIFFGGEPLISLTTMTSAVEYARRGAESRGKKAKLSITTNGTLFNDEIISFIKKNQIEVQVSLDGDKKTHDKMRTFSDGRGSYNTIKQWLPRLVANYTEKVSLRATLTPETYDFVASFKHLREWGAGSVIVRHGSGTEAEFRLNDSDCQQLGDSYSQLAELFLEEALRGEVSAKGAFPRYIITLCTARPRSPYCGAATNMLGVSPSGKFYPCADMAEREDYELGNVWEGIDWQKLNYWRDKLGGVDHMSVCQNCWARYLCGGGCIAQAARTNSNPWQPDYIECELNRQTIELSIWLYAELRRRNPKIFLQILPVNIDKWFKVE